MVTCWVGERIFSGYWVTCLWRWVDIDMLPRICGDALLRPLNF